MKIMERKASDNKYLHRDFHISADIGLSYVGEKYGDNGVREYLTLFAQAYYKPLADAIKAHGLAAMKDHIERIYEIEEASDALAMVLSDDCLNVEISYCPAIRFMKSKGHTPSLWYVEATRTVNATIADMADIGFSLLSYNEDNGAAAYRFFRRSFI